MRVIKVHGYGVSKLLIREVGDEVYRGIYIYTVLVM